MEIKVHDDRKMVEVWLTTAEKADPAIQAKLKQLYQTFKAKNFMVAVFQSGTRSLYDDLRYLAQSHRKRMAEREVKRDKVQMLSDAYAR